MLVFLNEKDVSCLVILIKTTKTFIESEIETMRYFEARLWDVNSSYDHRRWIYVPYDQLNAGPFSLLSGDPKGLGIVLIESVEKGSRRPYHKQKLALVLANQRQFALEQARRGVAIHYVSAPSYNEGLTQAVAKLGTLECMVPAERELRLELQPLVDDGSLTMHENRLWLTTADDFKAACGDGRWRMDRFYRHVRKKFGILVDSTGKPTGGRWSFDADNRKRWKGQPSAPAPLSFEPDAIVNEVCKDVEAMFGDHPGVLDPNYLPTTETDAQAMWQWAQDH